MYNYLMLVLFFTKNLNIYKVLNDSKVATISGDIVQNEPGLFLLNFGKHLDY